MISAHGSVQGGAVHMDEMPPATYTSLPLPSTIGPPTEPLYIIDDTDTHAKSQSRALLVVLSFMVMALGVIHFTGEHADPITNLLDFFDAFMGNEDDMTFETEEPAPVAAKPAPVAQSVEESVETVRPPFSQELVQNPYWDLPNKLGEHPAPMQRAWTMKEEEMWRFALDHEFTYQRFKAIKEIRARRLQNSSTLLYKALDQKKFWARMEAVFGLAEFGQAVGVDVVERAIGKTRPSLIKNYFSRFIAKRTPGEEYVLKHAIKLVDGPARANILRGLAKNRGEHQLYFAAALYDPAPEVQALVAELGPVSDAVVMEYQTLVVDAFSRKVGVRKAPAAEPVVEDQPTEFVPEPEAEDVTFFETATEEVDPEASEIIDDTAKSKEAEQAADGFEDLIKLKMKK